VGGKAYSELLVEESLVRVAVAYYFGVGGPDALRLALGDGRVGEAGVVDEGDWQRGSGGQGGEDAEEKGGRDEGMHVGGGRWLWCPVLLTRRKVWLLLESDVKLWSTGDWMCRCSVSILKIVGRRWES